MFIKKSGTTLKECSRSLLTTRPYSKSQKEGRVIVNSFQQIWIVNTVLETVKWNRCTLRFTRMDDVKTGDRFTCRISRVFSLQIKYYNFTKSPLVRLLAYQFKCDSWRCRGPSIRHPIVGKSVIVTLQNLRLSLVHLLRRCPRRRNRVREVLPVQSSASFDVTDMGTLLRFPNSYHLRRGFSLDKWIYTLLYMVLR